MFVLAALTSIFTMNSEITDIAVYLARTSQYMQRPSTLDSVHPSISYTGKVGELDDVHLVSVTALSGQRQEILDVLQRAPGVIKVEIQQYRQRAKRATNEF
jgi:hypothetical protein